MIADTELSRLYAQHIAHLTQAYATVLGSLGLDGVVLHSGSQKLRSQFDDNYWPLRVVPHFQHWLPLAHPDCALVVEAGKRPRLLWPRNTSFWEKPAMPEWSGWQSAFEIVELDGPRSIKDHLPHGNKAFVGDGHMALDWGFSVDETNAPRVNDALDQLRVTKTDYEVQCLAEANRRAALGHSLVAEEFRRGDRSELELHLVYLGATAQDDPETPYKNIVALGAHASTLHHIDYQRTRSPARSLLLDAGATFLGYASDITRTYCRRSSDAAESTFAHLIDGMQALQATLCGAATVGKPYEDLHEEAHKLVGALLREAGLVTLSADESDAHGVTRAFFPHGLGHSLGLQTHDVGCAQIRPKPRNPYLRNTTTIVERQVFTVEPGLYFIPALLDELRASPDAGSVVWPLVDALRPLGGIRIEDDLVVQGPGAPARNLTREVLPA